MSRKENYANMNYFLNVASTQPGIPSYVWIIVGGIAAIIVLVLAIKSFWISKIISILLSVAGILTSINGILYTEDLRTYALMGGVQFAIAFIFFAGNAIFDSGTEGDYLILGTLLHDTNHPFSAFCSSVLGCAICSALIFWAAYAWTFVIALVTFILMVIFNLCAIIKRITG